MVVTVVIVPALVVLVVLVVVVVLKVVLLVVATQVVTHQPKVTQVDRKVETIIRVVVVALVLLL